MTAYRKPHARVAHQSFRGIHEVDGVPSTHTPLPAAPDRKLPAGFRGSAPHPFTANKPIPAAPAVTVMVTIVLIAFLTSALTILEGHPNRSTIALACGGLLAAWTLLLALPALIRRYRR